MFRGNTMQRQICRLIVGLVVGFGMVGGATSASAYERTQTCDSSGMYSCNADQEPKPIAWPKRCVRYRINEEGSSDFSGDGQIGDELRGHVREAFQTWNAPSCSDFTMVEGDLTSNATVEYVKERGWEGNMNVIVFRDDEWSYGVDSATFALTSVTYSATTGRIADADMEINTAEYDFAHLSESRVGKGENIDISNTLTHEVGHFLGLDHPDNKAATMYGKAPAGEIKKRTLHQDDIDGLCAIYPGNDTWGACDDPEDFEPRDEDRDKSSCCSVGSGPVPQGSVVIAGVVLVGLRLWVWGRGRDQVVG